jgi:hypothetical protein
MILRLHLVEEDGVDQLLRQAVVAAEALEQAAVRAASAPAGAVDALSALDSALANAAPGTAEAVQQEVRTAYVNFATALLREANARSGRIGREVP